MAQLAREQLFQRILIFFAIVTAITGIFNMAYAGQLELSTFSGVSDSASAIPGQVVGGFGIGSASGYIEGANTAIGTVINEIDFTTSEQINSNVTTIVSGTWTLIQGTGLTLTSTPILSGINPDLNPSVVAARNVQSENGTYTISVTVNNDNAGGSFYVYPRFISGYSGSDLKVVFDTDGVHIKKFPLYLGVFDNGDDYFFAYDQAQDTSGSSTITTELQEVVSQQLSNTPDYISTLTVTKDGDELFTTNVRSILAGTNINDQVRHGGVGSDTVGFIIEGFSNTAMVDNSSSFFSGSQGIAGDPSGVNPLGAFYSFFDLIAQVLGLTQNAFVPFWLWAIVAIPCLSTLTLIGLAMLRGN